MSDSSSEKKEPGLRIWAWLPWLPLLLLGFMFVWRGEGYGGFLVPFFVYSGISFPIGYLVCRAYRGDKIGVNIAKAILFGGPLLAATAHIAEQKYWMIKYEQSWRLLQAYCEKDAKEIIHRTVTGVEGVLQMDPYTRYSLAEDGQYGIPDPWYQFSWQRMESHMLGISDGGYHYLEEKLNDPRKPNSYRRRFIRFEGDISQDVSKLDRLKIGELVSTDTIITPHALSQYGWRSKDITTDEMRALWISGGSIEIVEIGSQKTVAQLTNFYVAKGAKSWRKSWEIAGAGYGQCQQVSSFSEFLRKTLIPTDGLPARDKLLELSK